MAETSCEPPEIGNLVREKLHESSKLGLAYLILVEPALFSNIRVSESWFFPFWKNMRPRSSTHQDRPLLPLSGWVKSWDLHHLRPVPGLDRAASCGWLNRPPVIDGQHPVFFTYLDSVKIWETCGKQAWYLMNLTGSLYIGKPHPVNGKHPTIERVSTIQDGGAGVHNHPQYGQYMGVSIYGGSPK